MKVYRCDRCGAHYNERKYTNVKMTIEKYLKKKGVYFDERIDLCDSCQRQLNDWLNEGGTWRIEHNEGQNE